LDLFHRIPSVSRGFDSPTLRDFQTLVGFLSSKIFSRILQDFFVLRRSIPMDDFLCLVVPLGCLSPNLSIALEVFFHNLTSLRLGFHILILRSTC
jgi:hypothetical protein